MGTLPAGDLSPGDVVDRAAAGREPWVMRQQCIPVASLVGIAILLAGCPTVREPVRDGGVVDLAEASLADPAAAEEGSSGVPYPLMEDVRRVLAENLEHRQLSAEVHGAWQILHGVLAYGTEFPIETSEGPQLAVEYLLGGGTVQGFDPMPGDRFPPAGETADALAGTDGSSAEPRRGLRMHLQPGTKVGQGHRDQWLAVLAQAGLGPDTRLRSRDQEYRFEDWVRQVEWDIPLNLELEFSWTLIGLLAYRPTDHRWTARDGNDYDIEILLQSELEQSLPESACGGTHRLIGIAMALDRRRAEGAPIVGVWADAERLLADSIELARQNQNPDGSYGSSYHHRGGWTRDLGESLGTTGHVLEFLSLAASDETLRSPWVRRSVRHLCDLLDQCREIDLECGALYHALHGLQIYAARMAR